MLEDMYGNIIEVNGVTLTDERNVNLGIDDFFSWTSNGKMLEHWCGRKRYTEIVNGFGELNDNNEVTRIGRYKSSEVVRFF